MCFRNSTAVCVNHTRINVANIILSILYKKIYFKIIYCATPTSRTIHITGADPVELPGGWQCSLTGWVYLKK